MKCVRCNSQHIQKDGNHNGYQRYKCMDCKKRFDNGLYEGKHIIHFNTKIKATKYNKLTKENYCEKTNKISSELKKYLKYRIEYRNYKIPNDIYLDSETYTEEYVNEHYDDCMENFNRNMKKFSKLDYNDFNKYLLKFVKENGFKEIKDLKEVDDKQGIYILVLDEYKQVYIGCARKTDNTNIKKRIIQHWNKRKEFDRLIFGMKEKSILSIESFGALDTTRIFYKEIKNNLYQQEEKIVYEFNNIYTLNRVGGGINSEKDYLMRNHKLICSMKRRNFEN